MKKLLLTTLMLLCLVLKAEETYWVTLQGTTDAKTWTQLDPNNKYLCKWTDGSYLLMPDVNHTERCSRGWWTINDIRYYNFYVKNMTADLFVPANIRVHQVKVVDLVGETSGKTLTFSSNDAQFEPASVTMHTGTGEQDYDMTVTGHQTGEPLHIVTTGGTFGFALKLLVEKDESQPLTIQRSNIADGALLYRQHTPLLLTFSDSISLTSDYEATLNGTPVEVLASVNQIKVNLGGMAWNSQNTFCLRKGSVKNRIGKTNESDIVWNLEVGDEPLPAFPGAEGGGMYTTGGRGGKVYHVTTLEDSDNPSRGMLRWAVNQSGPRTIVFDIAGTIHLKSRIDIQNGDITIAGQTAPGQGITLADHNISVGADNVIIRYIRVRMGAGNLSDGEGEGADAMGGRGHRNIIIDHCSCSWSTDECVSFYGNEDFTLQWSIISESLMNSAHPKGNHGYGGIWGGCYATFHHNYMAHHQSRTPRWGAFYGMEALDMVDMRCNLIYNHGGNGAYGAEGMSGNIVNNVYKPGLSTATGAKRGRIMAAGTNGDYYGASNYTAARPRVGRLYVTGNLISSRQDDPLHPTESNEKNATNDNWKYGVRNQLGSTFSEADKDSLRAKAEMPCDFVTLHAPLQVLDKVLTYAGCSLGRDEIDDRLANEGRNGTCTFRGSTGGSWGLIDNEYDTRPSGAGDDWSPWPNLEGGSRPEGFDSDSDGMSDSFEDLMGLDPSNASDGNNICTHAGYEGYTELEHYLASLVSHITQAQNQEALNHLQSPCAFETEEWDVYDLAGRLICHTANPLDTASLKSGFYLVRQGSMVRKIRVNCN